jgi:non-heme chloroperoxidase
MHAPSLLPPPCRPVGVAPVPTLPAGDLVVHTAGGGPPVILLHGMTSSHREWLGLKSALAPGFTCLAFDARGHGARRADNASVCVGDLAADLATVVASVAPRKPVVVGHCIGAATILEFVRRCGDEALAGVMLVDQSPRMLTAPDWELGVYSGFSAVDNMAFEWQMRRDPAEAWLRLLACGFNAEARAQFDANTPATQRTRERLGALPSAAWLPLWKSIAHKDYRDEVAALSVPLQVVLGGASNLFDTPRLARWFAGTGRRAEVVRYEGADHAPHAGAPARFARDVAGFAARCAGMRATADAC